MRVLLTGSRDWTENTLIFQRFLELREEHGDKLIVVHGDARGADTAADHIARDLGITRIKYPANWVRWSNAAGPMRNGFMLDDAKPDIVIACPLSDSKGTKDMISVAERANIPVFTLEIPR